MSNDPNSASQSQPNQPTGGPILAILSLLFAGLSLPLSCCCGFLALAPAIVGIALGAIALAQISDGRATGKELAWIGIALSAACLIFHLVFIVLNLIGLGLNLPNMMQQFQNMPGMGN